MNGINGINSLIEPCKKYISDKVNIDLSTEEVTKYIRTALIPFNNKTNLNKDEKKLILISVLDLVNKDNSLESVIQTLENERNTPVLSIPYDFEDTITQYQPYYKTVLVQSTKTDFQYTFNTVSKLIPFKVFVKNNNPIINLWINDNLYHFYKKKTDDIMYQTIKELENISITNTVSIKLENIQNTINHRIESLTQIDENHYKIIIANNNKEKSDLKVYSNNKIYNFYYVTDDLYLTDDRNININNGVAVLTTQLIYILFKVM
jgi:hypothetical protein